MELSSELTQQAINSPDGEQSSLFDLGGVDEAGSAEQQNETSEVPASSGGSVPCDFCNRPVRTDDPDAYQEIVSWVRGERKGNTALRKYTGMYAHGDCVGKVRAGMAPDENSIFDLDAETSEPEGDIFIPIEVSHAWRAGYRDGYSGFTPVELPVDPEYVKGFNAGDEDRTSKNSLFANAGKKETFVVDPATHRRIVK